MSACLVAQAPTAKPEPAARIEPLPTATPEPPPTQTAEPTATATEPPTATATITNTPTTTATPTAVLDDPQLRLGSPDWQDTFESGANWNLYANEHTRIHAEAGQLILTALQADGWSGWTLANRKLGNFYLAATVTSGACVGLDRYGLVVRVPPSAADPAVAANAGYLFGLSCDGRYSLRKWDGERFNFLIDWARSEDIQAGVDQPNRMGLLAENERIVLYANGRFLAEVIDDSFVAPGGFGLFVGADNTDDFTVWVDEIAYWTLP